MQNTKSKTFSFGNMMISIIIMPKEKFNLNNKKRSRKLYKKRRGNGHCIQCNKKTTINPRTNRPYQRCAKHRERECELKKLQRQNKYKLMRFA